jgi:septum formation protein
MNNLPKNPSLVLASESAGRRAQLEQLRLRFRTAPAHIDETPLALETPEALVRRLARSKAAAVAPDHPDCWIVGADQVAVHEGLATSKPLTETRAIFDLGRFSGGEVVFLTAVCLRGPGGEETVLTDDTRVRFRPLTDAEIERYVARDRPLDCAGCFRLESLGPTLFESVVTSDPTALLGLPLIGLSRLLRDAGFALP